MSQLRRLAESREASSLRNKTKAQRAALSFRYLESPMRNLDADGEVRMSGVNFAKFPDRKPGEMGTYCMNFTSRDGPPGSAFAVATNGTGRRSAAFHHLDGLKPRHRCASPVCDGHFGR